MARETHEITDMAGKCASRDVDALIARLAERQHGLVAWWQLKKLGVGRGAFEHRIVRRRLHRVHQGVYSVGHRKLTREARWMAAVLAGGEGAALSHRSAGAHHGIRQTARRDIEVTVPRRRRNRPGLQFHVAVLPSDEVTVVDGIPVTTVPRTIFDLAAVDSPHQVERAITEAEHRRLTDPLPLSALLTRYPGARGTRTIREILAERGGGQGITREELEHRFLAFLDEHGLPRPRLNHHIQVGDRLIEADCVWPEQRLIVELDGYTTHHTRRAFEGDRARDRALAVAKWRPIRVTWRHLHREPDALDSDLKALLGIAAGPLGYPSGRH